MRRFTINSTRFLALAGLSIVLIPLILGQTCVQGGGTDTDGDGVLDADDACPNDADKSASAGACGCGEADTDTDGDGRADCNENCDDDPDKTVAGTCGCGTNDSDTDGDGTADCNDACPNDASKTVAGTCGCGRADADTDGDGTPDCSDVDVPDDDPDTVPIAHTFTIGLDSLTGTGNDDTFSAPVTLSSIGVLTSTLQTSDKADGGSGRDVLLAVFSHRFDIMPTLSNIEVIVVTDYHIENGTSVLDASRITGLRKVVIDGSDDSNDLRIINLNGPIGTEVLNSNAKIITADPTPCSDDACRVLPDCYDAGASFTVSIEVTPPVGTFAYGAEDSPPSNWSVSNISHDGAWDATNGSVKWSFLDDDERVLTYTVTPPGSANGNACSEGQVNFDGGANQDIGGDKCVGRCAGS